MELHERIYQLRKEKNMTQQDLADRLGVSRQAVSRWEMGTATPEIESLTAMSRIFGMTLDELVTGEKQGPAAADQPAVEKKAWPDPRKWIIAWAVTWLVIVGIYAVWMLLEWKMWGALVAIAPVALIVQVINLGFRLGLVFAIVYVIRRFWKK